MSTTTTTTVPNGQDRAETIAFIRAELRRRTGRTWSVTGGTGTAWGWITITAPPARRVQGWYMTEEDEVILSDALNLTRVSRQGVTIPASDDYRREYMDRARGVAPAEHGTPYWD